jgi:hypothetical protein
VTLTNSPVLALAGVVSNLVANNPVPLGTNAPKLLMGACGGAAALLYPAWASNGILQFSPNMAPGSWTALSMTSSVLSNYNVITQTATNGAGFFRLMH